jgi:single-stranded-DNA-specific exonuclease
MLAKRWLIAQPASQQHLNQFGRISPVLAQVLINRGFESPKAAKQFLSDKHTTHDPFDMPDMEKAVQRIIRAIKEYEPIVVYGDFDADGVTSTTLLVQALRALGAHARPYIPHRVDEGYGLNIPALKQLKDEGTALVITVDCGIRSIEEVEAVEDMDIIITDHHSLGPELPRAYAVVNPKREGYPEPMLAGVGVAFKVVQALIMVARKDPFFADKKAQCETLIPLDTLFDLVALGTVADLMPLSHLENRILVQRGLETLNRAKRPGIKALAEIANIEPGKITATTIGFGFGPRINAAGRLDDAMIAFKLLASDNMDDAKKWAQRLNDLNEKRQNITRSAQQLIGDQLGDDSENLPLIFAADSTLSPGVVGLVAGRLTEEYFRPAIVMEKGAEESRASCRSIPQFDITHALDQCADLLVRHGGHALAAGFTVMNDNIPALVERLTDMAAESLAGRQIAPTLDVDIEVNIHELNESLAKELTRLEPCGAGNPAPVLMCRNVHVADYRTVGRDDKHLKMKISRAAQPPLDAIGFGLGDWVCDMPARVDIAFQLEINEWNGRRTLQANLQDIRQVTKD